jgi:putative peptidoglycan binding protein
MAAVVVAVTAAASAEAVAFVAAALTVAFAVVALMVAFAVAGFTVPLTAVAFVAAAFMMVAFAAVGSTIAASTIGSSSLVILGTRSFTIPIHTTGTIPIAIILMVTDTAALATVAFAAVGDPYNEPVYQGNAGYTDQLVGQIQLRLARAGYYNGLIDGVSGNATRRAIVNMSYERAHSLPADGQIRGRLLTTMGLG